MIPSRARRNGVAIVISFPDEVDLAERRVDHARSD